MTQENNYDWDAPSAFQEVKEYGSQPHTSSRRRSMFFDVMDAYSKRCNLCDERLKSENDIVRCSQCSYLLCHQCLNNLYGERRCPGCRQVYEQYNSLPRRLLPPSPVPNWGLAPSPITPVSPYYFDNSLGIDFSQPLSPPPVRDSSPIRVPSPVRDSSPIRVPSPTRFIVEPIYDEPVRSPRRNLFSLEYDFIETDSEDDVIYISD